MRWITYAAVIGLACGTAAGQSMIPSMLGLSDYDDIAQWVAFLFDPMTTNKGPVHNITQWSSLRDHGGQCGWLAVSTGPGPGAEIVETRHGNIYAGIGGVRKIAVDFDTDITPDWDGDVDGGNIVITMNHTPPAGCLAVDGGTVAVTNGGFTLEFDVTGPPSANCTVDISGAVAGIQHDATCTFRTCDGNVNYDTKTDLTDAALVRSVHGTMDPVLHPYFDVNCDCKIDLTDFSLLVHYLNGLVVCP